MEIQKLQYNIAEHWVELLLPDAVQKGDLLPSFAPFAGIVPDGMDVMCSMLVANGEPCSKIYSRILVDTTKIMGNRFRLLEFSKGYIVELQMVPNGQWSQLICDRYFCFGYVYMDLGSIYKNSVLSFFMMMMYGQAAILRRTLLVHASVVEKDGKGYAFLGKSGTGKSTHSRLWLNSLNGFSLLNDDNPAIRIMNDGKVWIYGTPWSGKTLCYKNERALLSAIVRLEQSSSNLFHRESGVSAILALLPGCISMRWDNKLYKILIDILEIIICKVPVGHLKCLPNDEAASLCYEEVTKIK